MVAELKNFFKNTFNFNGYASRSEYAVIVIIGFVIGMLLGIIVAIFPGQAYIGTIISVVWAIPFITLTMRRFHDAGINMIFALLLMILSIIIYMVPVGQLWQDLIELVCLICLFGIGIFKPTKESNRKQA